MIKRLAYLSFLLLFFIQSMTEAQDRSVFSGETDLFKEELISFMGPNLNTVQQENLNTFIVRWDSTLFGENDKNKIVELAIGMSSRHMRTLPHFNNFLLTLNSFIDNKNRELSLTNWFSGLEKLVSDDSYTNNVIDHYFLNTCSYIKDDILFESGSVKWKVIDDNPAFEYDTTFHIRISDATLTCYSQGDSTLIYNASGIYFPHNELFLGKKGIVTWEKAGYPGEDVFATTDDYSLSLNRNSFTIDSALLTHTTYFREPVYGVLTDRAASYGDKTRATHPQFVTYTKHFRIDNLYEGVNYEGGLTFEGSNVKGTGENYLPSKITLFRNDTLYIKLLSAEFVFSKTGLNSQETSFTLYLDKDSIYHSNLGFSYITATRQVNLFRTNNPISKSPYFNSFHNLDMYFEYLSWDMNESRIILSRARGSALGQAQFESSSFFNPDYFMQLMGIDDYHPLYRLVQFSEWYYSETFPVSELAKWMNKPVESVTGLCIDLANKGFVFYDRANNEITIKKKTKDFIASNAGKIDYDIIHFYSETESPLDNAVLDLNNYRLTISGVNNINLSDAQKVAIFPYNRKLTVGEDRNIEFDGVVAAGLFTIFGHDFTFNYDTFKIRLQTIDSIKIAVETEEKDIYGNPVIESIDNLIQLGTAELFIDNPENKSGIKNLEQYPIINALTYSYIFYDKIPGLVDVYKKENFYFKIDPFTYENIDHYSYADLDLNGEFVAGNIFEPLQQHLTIQEDNSLGFNMVIPEEGLEVYGTESRLYESLSMDNDGLTGSGTLNHLASVTRSEQFRFFPDSMLTQASSFDIIQDATGVYPDLTSEDVSIKWLPENDEWIAVNNPDLRFNMFNNGTTLDGSLLLTSASLDGSGIINTTDSRITSNLYSFSSNEINADTADYNLKSLTASGYSFIAENASTNINFDLNRTKFHLNTDSSLVKFPEIQYLCTMTDFDYDMEKRILNMEQEGGTEVSLLTPEELLAQNFSNLDQPTFYATNNMRDTISFTSLNGRYYLDDEYIEAENINYIHIADALIQPEEGKIRINKRAEIEPLKNAIVAVNNRHILHSANIDIESAIRYSGSGIFDYTDYNDEIQHITFPELTVDTLTTTALGYITAESEFTLSPAFTFAGDVALSARDDFLTFTGSAGIVHDCDAIRSYSIKFKSQIDPDNVLIPVGEKPRDSNDNMVFSGSFVNIDSVHMYPAFLSARKSWSDVALVNSKGYLYYERDKGNYKISSLEKLADPFLPGNMVTFDRNGCIISSEGELNYGADYDLLTLTSAGNVVHTTDSGTVKIEAIIALDFYFPEEALNMMSDEIRMIPTLKPVNLNSELNNKGMKDIFGEDAATRINEEISLFGTSGNLPREYNFELLLNDVNLTWHEETASFRSEGEIGIGFIGKQPVNTYVDGFLEIQRRRSGDMLDIYLKADESTWYYFSYFRGVMMVQAANGSFNSLIVNTKLRDRKHPDSSVRVPYTYMIAAEDRLARFLRRMTSSDDYDE